MRGAGLGRTVRTEMISRSYGLSVTDDILPARRETEPTALEQTAYDTGRAAMGFLSPAAQVLFERAVTSPDAAAVSARLAALEAANMAQQLRRVRAALDATAEAAQSEDEAARLADRVAESQGARDLLRLMVGAASVVGDVARLTAIGRLFRRGVLAPSPNDHDLAASLIRTLGEMTDSEVKFLAAIAADTEPQLHPGAVWGSAVGGPKELQDSALASLIRHGLLDRGGTTYGGGAVWGLTTLGRELAASLGRLGDRVG